MTLDFLFWLLMVLWFLFGIYQAWQTPPGPAPLAWFPLGNAGFLFLLFLLLGIRVFGWPIKT